MATLESSQIQVLVDSVKDRDEPRYDQQLQVRGELTPLLGTTQRWYGMRLKSRRCCVKSKAALLVLCWNALINLLVGYILEYGSMAATVSDKIIIPYPDEFRTYALVFFGFLALLPSGWMSG